MTVTGVIDEEITPAVETSSLAPATKGLAGTPGYEPEITEVEESTPPETKTVIAKPRIEK